MGAFTVPFWLGKPLGVMPPRTPGGQRQYTLPQRHFGTSQKYEPRRGEAGRGTSEREASCLFDFSTGFRPNSSSRTNTDIVQPSVRHLTLTCKTERKESRSSIGAALTTDWAISPGSSTGLKKAANLTTFTDSCRAVPERKSSKSRGGVLDLP